MRKRPGRLVRADQVRLLLAVGVVGLVEATIGFEVEVGLHYEMESEGELSWAKLCAEQSKMARPHDPAV